MSYKKLEIWQLSRDLTIDIYRMTLEQLPGFEMYEEGSQIRRSIKSVRSNIYDDLHDRLDILGRKLNRFIESVMKTHQSVKDGIAEYETGESES
jgi:hypothetical protein